MKIGNRFFDTKNHTYIMGILNVTPDSFSDGGKWNHMDEALKWSVSAHVPEASFGFLAAIVPTPVPAGSLPGCAYPLPFCKISDKSLVPVSSLPMHIVGFGPQ